jgi:hypothetical protein
VRNNRIFEGDLDLSIFEIIMLLCFGAAWPFSVHRSYRARTNAGKSLVFMCIVLIGYAAGTLHKLYYSYDAVIFLYLLNGLLVSTDLLIYFRNKKIMAAAARG